MSFCETAGNVENRRRLTLETFLQAQLASEEVADADNLGPPGGILRVRGGFRPKHSGRCLVVVVVIVNVSIYYIFMCRITQDSSRQQTTDCS